MKVSVLGNLELVAGGRTEPLPGLRPRRALAALTVDVNRPVSVDRLTDLTWEGAPPPSARNTLQSHLSRLRRQLGSERIALVPGGYVFQAGPDQLDVLEFEDLVAAAEQCRRTGDHQRVADLLHQALALWRGDPFADIADDDVAGIRAAELRRRHRAAIEDHLRAHLALGHHRDLLPRLERLTAQHPEDEGLAVIRALALHRCGNQPAALAVLSQLRTTLRDELGLDPSPHLRAFEEQLLNRDPALEPAGSRVTTVTTEPFVGRVAEVEVLQRVLACAGSGSGAVALLSGDPGIGKTRLASHLVQRSGAGFDVLWGRSFDDRAAAPLAPWREVLSTWLTRHSELEPELGRRWPAARRFLGLDPDVGDAPEDLHEGATATVDVLHAAARLHPLLVVLDDVHWCDEASIKVVELLSRDVAAAPLAVFVLYRDSEVDRAHAFRSVAADLARRPQCVEVPLTGLDRPAITAYLVTRGSPDPSDWLLDQLQERTAGNPFYLTAVVDALCEDGPLDEVGPETRWPLPEGVRGLTWRRVDQLPPPTVDLLCLAALAGDQLDLGHLGRVLDLPGSRLLEAVEPALTSRLLEADPRDVTQLRFPHALVREAVADRLAPGQRLELHRRLGHSLLDRKRQLDEETTLRAARHLAAAAVLDEQTAGLACDLCLAAAEHARFRGAWADAAEHQARALDIAQDHTSYDDRRLAAIQVRLAATLRLIGQFERSATHYREAAVRTHGLDLAVEVEAALGFESCSVDGRRHRTGADDPSLALLEQALAACPNTNTVHRAQLLGALSQALAFCDLPGRATETAEAGVAEARQLSDEGLRARILVTLHPLLDGHQGLEARVELAHAAWEAADHGGETLAGLEARGLGVPDLMRLGRLGAAQSLVDTVEARAEAAGSEAHRWRVPMWRAAMATAIGRYAEAEILVGRFSAAGRHHGYADVDRVHAWQLMLLRWRQGRTEEAREAVEAAAREDDFEPWSVTRVLTNALTGRLDEAHEGFLDLAARRFRLSLPFAGIQDFAACLLAEPCRIVGDGEHARLLFDLISPAVGQNMVLGSGAALLGDARLSMGLLANQYGDQDLARRLLVQAAESNATWTMSPAAQQARDALASLDHRPAGGP